MKRIMLILIIFVVSLFSITRTVNAGGNPFTIEYGLTGINSTDWSDVIDSCGVKLERHLNSTIYHHLADAQTDSTEGTSNSVRGSIYWVNDYITNLSVHFLLDTLTVDSVHFSPDTLNTSLISLNGSYTDMKTGLASAIYDYNLHCSKDTTDFSDVHIALSVDTLVTKIGTSSLFLTDYSELVVTATGSSVSSGATIYIDGSYDDISYTHIDSIVVSADGLATPFRTNDLWQYMKVYCKYYTDGSYKLQILTGGK